MSRSVSACCGEAACGEQVVSAQIMAEEIMAGEIVAGEIVAGEIVAGEIVAGEIVAEQPTIAGPTAAGPTAATQSTAPVIGGLDDAPATRHPESRLVEAAPPDLQTVEPAVAVTDAAVAADLVEPASALAPTAEADAVAADAEMAAEQPAAEKPPVEPAEVDAVTTDAASVEPPMPPAPPAPPAEENLFDEFAADAIDDDAPITDGVGTFPEPEPLHEDDAGADGETADPLGEPMPDEPQLPSDDTPAVEQAEEASVGATDEAGNEVGIEAPDQRAVAAVPAVPEPLRLWTDASGQRAIVGTLVMMREDAVVIRKAGGTMVTVDLAQLSDVDRQHARVVGPRLAAAAGFAGGGSPAAAGFAQAASR